MKEYTFNGKAFASSREVKLKKLIQEKNLHPKIVAFMVGDNEASRLYLRLKRQAAERVGIELQTVEVANPTKEDLIDRVKAYNADSSVTGIMFQLPLGGELDKDPVKSEILYSIDQAKDVDGQTSLSPFLPATVKAIISIIDEAENQGFLVGKDRIACIVGATGDVGKPLSEKLEDLGWSVLRCNSKTSDLKAETLKANLIVSATGKPGIITKDMVQRDAVIIDVGSPKPDVDRGVEAAFVTPVPGGVGPVTVVSLLENTFMAAQKD